MKTVIAGGRDYIFTEADKAFLNTLNITEVVSGGAKGADACGEAWARERNIPVKRFNADWNKHRLAAGPIRNAEMAKYAQAVVLFPGSKGTASMRNEAKKANLIIYER